MGCNYPKCNEKSSKRCTLVHLCQQHYEMIDKETNDYYRPTQEMKYEERKHFNQIKHLIPWRAS
ncbi:hypothetical protein [Chengkuizengella axinellae]|uniref:HNH endonuclease n=1 Tax=Chengkuizengella axinellae TaxID=3064388 RepID=A0ABT9IXN9_9BACL|nr:hypothetical protein [Chengkuizengella sp. 2205SS18-9]MDP5274003.1 hypothetical protein [Chengkuizengella sp. 2205SS18-9]